VDEEFIFGEQRESCHPFFVFRANDFNWLRIKLPVVWLILRRQTAQVLFDGAKRGFREKRIPAFSGAAPRRCGVADR
jgi:hypothetical protein